MTPAARRDPIARTTTGLLRGSLEHQGSRPLHVFRGIPYARPPIGPGRFASPRPAEPWTGIRDATAFGPPFLQPRTPGSGEDALYANVWTPDVAGRRPVLLYIHGGGWQVGAGSVPTFDGAKPAARGELVVVNFNYRLGVFGWGRHEDLADPETGLAGNWGLQDQIAMVRWVRENAEAFGGDPDAITLCGTSAGAITARLLASAEYTEGAVRRLIAISAALPWVPAFCLSQDDATKAQEHLAAEFGTTVAGLRDVPGEPLQQAWLRLFAGPPSDRLLASGREYRGPVEDPVLVPGGQTPLPAIPVMSVHNHTEGAFFTDPRTTSFPPAPPAPVTEEELRGAVRDVLAKCVAEVPDDVVTGCLAAYRKAAAAEGLAADPLSLWTEIWGDVLFRHRIVRLAERHARSGRTPQYVMEFAHPVRPPHFGTPHDATSKFLFGSHAHPDLVAQFGDGPDERRVSDAFVDLVASFVHGTAPASSLTPPWPEFSPDRPSTMILGGPATARIGTASKLGQLRYWDDIAWIPGA